MGNTASKPECGEGYWAWCFWRGITWNGAGFTREIRMDFSGSKEHCRSSFATFFHTIRPVSDAVLHMSRIELAKLKVHVKYGF